jgi:hypothetical protein
MVNGIGAFVPQHLFEFKCPMQVCLHRKAVRICPHDVEGPPAQGGGALCCGVESTGRFGVVRFFCIALLGKEGRGGGALGACNACCYTRGPRSVTVCGAWVAHLCACVCAGMRSPLCQSPPLPLPRWPSRSSASISGGLPWTPCKRCIEIWSGKTVSHGDRAGAYTPVETSMNKV